ncbi:MAG: hypothetical protein ACFFDF_19180 [Candidatus Odinarchaeota archaeon]
MSNKKRYCKRCKKYLEPDEISKKRKFTLVPEYKLFCKTCGSRIYTGWEIANKCYFGCYVLISVIVGIFIIFIMIV